MRFRAEFKDHPDGVVPRPGNILLHVCHHPYSPKALSKGFAVACNLKISMPFGSFVLNPGPPATGLDCKMLQVGGEGDGGVNAVQLFAQALWSKNQDLFGLGGARRLQHVT